MEASKHQDTHGWQRLDNASFGIIYGAITVLGILMAAGTHPEALFETAAILFGSVLAITLAKSFAELMAHAIQTGERITRHAWRTAWRHSSPTLAVVNLPALFLVAAGLGWMTVDISVLLSHLVCIGLLLVLGARAGWVIDGRIVPAILGGLFAGGIGFALSLMKLVIH